MKLIALLVDKYDNHSNGIN